MKIISKFIFLSLANFLAFLIANHLITGFTISGNFVDLAKISLIFALLNVLVKPLLKIVFFPLMIFSAGTFSLILNTLLLYILDIFSTTISIEGIAPLVITTLLVSLTNVLISLLSKL